MHKRPVDQPADDLSAGFFCFFRPLLFPREGCFCSTKRQKKCNSVKNDEILPEFDMVFGSNACYNQSEL